MTHTTENGTPGPTRIRFRFKIVHGGYICGECGAVVSGEVSDVKRHDDWHDLLTPAIPPGSDQS